MERSKAILVDITKCIGCRACEQACKEIHGFPTASETHLSTLRTPPLHELSGSGLRLGMPGGRFEEDGTRSCNL